MNLAVIPVAASVSEWSDSFLERLPLFARDWMTSWLPEPWRWLVNSLLSIAVILSVFGLLFAYVTLVVIRPVLLGAWGPCPTCAGCQ